MSCWVTEHAVRVPSYHNTNGKLFFAIELTKRASSPAASNATVASRNSFQSSTSSGSDRHFTTYRSFSQFRALWKLLAGHCVHFDDNDSSDATHSSSSTFSRLRTRLAMASALTNSSSSSSQCRCASTDCSFHKVHDAMRAFPFPSRRCLQLTPKQHVLRARRAALERFVREVHSFFATFPNALLRERLSQQTPCRLLHAFAAFVQADVHFPRGMTGALRQPLALDGWRQQCAAQMMMIEDASDDDRNNNNTLFDQDESLQIVHAADCATLAIATANPAAQTTTPTTATNAHALLPALRAKTMRVETVHSFMDEFCDHVLQQYAHDIVELADPALTPARRWEICLYVACRLGHTYAVQLILFSYADAHASMADGSTCLHIAARMGHSDIVALLLDDGASVNQTNAAGVTPLIAACRNGCVDVAKQLLSAGANVAACSARGTSPLHAAVVSQSVDVVQLLVAHGADVNAATASGITPLHFAAKLGTTAIAAFLLQHDADAMRRTANDSDALMIAAANGHVTVCELLEKRQQRRRGASAERTGSAVDDSSKRCNSSSSGSQQQLARRNSKAGEMVRMHSQRLTARQCA